MTLRVRLLLGYGYLVTLLLVAVGGSAWGFLDLSRGLEQILRRDFRSVEAAMAMARALERLDSLTLVLLATPGGETAELEPFERAFEQALAEAERNAADAPEAALVARIAQRYSGLRATRQALLAQPAGGLQSYESQLFPAFSRLLDDILRLLSRRQQAMLESDRGARRGAARSLAGLGFLAAGALLSLSFQVRAMQRGLFARLRELGAAVAAIAAGDRRRRLRGGEDDELAALARQLNRVLDARDELQGRMEGRIAHHRQLVLGLVHSFGEPVAVLGLDGKLVAHNLPPPDVERLEGLESWASGPGRELLDRRDAPAATAVGLGDGAAVEVELLRAGAERPTAWLIRFAGSGAGGDRRRRSGA